MNKLDLTREEGKRIVFGDSSEYETISDEVIENTRWSILHKIIIKRKSDNRYFKDVYSVGATEQQYEEAYDFSVPEFEEVFPFEIKKTVFLTKEELDKKEAGE